MRPNAKLNFALEKTEILSFAKELNIPFLYHKGTKSWKPNLSHPAENRGKMNILVSIYQSKNESEH